MPTAKPPTKIELSRRMKVSRLLAIVLFAPATFLLYYGSTMLLLVPGYRGEPYLAKERTIYGLYPTLFSLCLLAGVGFFWSRSSKSTWIAASIWAVMCSAGAIILFWLGLVITQQR